MTFNLTSILACLVLINTAAAQSTLAWSIRYETGSWYELPVDFGLDEFGNSYLISTGSETDRDLALDGFLTKLSSSGEVLWTATFATPSVSEYPSCLLVARDGSCFLGGDLDMVDEPGNGSIARIDSEGGLVWLQWLPSSVRDMAFALDGSVLAAGQEWVGPPDIYACVASIAPDGRFLWKRLIQGAAPGNDNISNNFRNIDVSSDGSIYASGAFGSSLGSSLGLAKLSPSGDLEWQWEYSSAHVPSFSALRRQAFTGNGDIVVAGDLFTDVVVARISPSGTLRWLEIYASGHGDRLGELKVIGETIWFSVGSGPYLDTVIVRLNGDGKRLSVTPLVPGGLPKYAPGGVLTPGTAGHAFVNFIVHPWGRPQIAQIDSEGQINWDQGYSYDDLGFVTHTCFARGDRLLLAGKTYGTQTGGLFVAQINLSDSPQAYCMAKTNSLGCTPSLTFAGMSSATSQSGFEVRADSMLSHQTGMFAYGFSGSASTPFAGGLLCIQRPILRTPPRSSGGHSHVDDCSGRVAIDWNAFAHGLAGGDPDPALLVPGTAVYCQAWGRDPGFVAPENWMLSNAMRFVVLP